MLLPYKAQVDNTGWLGTGTGIVLGILAGTGVYARQTRKTR